MEQSERLTPEVLRIIDANLDRCGEGLRVLEELARFGLNDAGLAGRLKDLRHRILTVGWPVPADRLGARDAAGDVGADTETADQRRARDLPAVAMANARRVQEALRVIEEMAVSTVRDVTIFRQARFDLYEIEKILADRLSRRDKAGRLRGLYAIIDTEALGNRRHDDITREVISGGANVVQLRDKTTPKKDLLIIAEKLKNICNEQNVLFIVNDHLDIALAVNADGLHLGQDDLPASVARRLLNIGQLLGISTRTPEAAAAAQEAGADYIGVGAMYPTASRDNAEVVGPERLSRVRTAISLPIVAIGGITAANADSVISAGADAIAVIGAILGAVDSTTAAHEIASKFEV
jgi:thiamine-phosphate pyrophosphorylase